MKTLLLIPVLTLLCSCAHTSDKARVAPIRPSLTASIERGEKVQKLNKRAMDDAEELRRIDAQSKTTLEQLDDKIVKLLEK